MTLIERLEAADQLWSCYESARTYDAAMEYIKAIEYNYRRIDQERERRRVRSRQSEATAAKRRRRVQMFERNRMDRDMQCGLILGILVLILFGLLFAASGCTGTVQGVMNDTSYILRGGSDMCSDIADSIRDGDYQYQERRYERPIIKR